MKFKALMLKCTVVCVLGLVAVWGPASVLAETIELKFAHPYSPQHPQQTEAFEPWARQVEELSGGRLKITFVGDGVLGKPGEIYDVVVMGIADIGWDVADYNADKFPLTSVFEIPFMIHSAEQGSTAMWRTYAKTAGLQKEFNNMKLLELSCHAPGVFATTKKPIEKMEDLKGLKMLSHTSFTFDALTSFGAKPEAFPVTQYYKVVQMGMVDGLVLPFDGIFIFKLHELLKYYTPANFYVGNFWAGMNNAKYDSLPDDLKKIIDETSGEALSRQCGRVFDGGHHYGEKLGLETGMQKVEILPAELEKLQAVKKPMQDAWIKKIKAQGLPGEDVLAAALAELEHF